MSKEPKDHPYRDDAKPEYTILTLENILTISAEDYGRIKNKEIELYVPRGIVSNVKCSQFNDISVIAPDGAEVIVGCRIETKTEGEYLLFGTALIPKRYLREKEEKEKKLNETLGDFSNF